MRNSVDHHVAHLERAVEARRAEQTLCRLALLGGPFDGHQAPCAWVPPSSLEVVSGQPGCCGAKTGSVVVPRIARYEWVSTRLLLSDREPVVVCRYQYRGTAAGSSPQRSMWRRFQQFVLRLSVRARLRPVVRAAARSARSFSHVQD